MAKDLVFYTNPMSRGRITRWMLEEIGAPYRTEVLDYGTTMKAPEYLAVNPMGKVPAILHGDVIVTEGAAICAYLADAFPEAGLAPAVDDPLRGTYYRWLFFAAAAWKRPPASRRLALSCRPRRAAWSVTARWLTWSRR
ncbi:MAG: glutathione S-transferase N-terminal domain-containing protein [Terricaulis sp.]